MSIPVLHLRFFVVALSALLFMSGCLRSAGPDLGVEALRDQTEKRSLQQAETAFLRADYSTAVSLLNRFLRTHPQSSRSLEARWWLARAYQKAGSLSSAIVQYRFLANTRPGNVYQTDARSRVAQLERRLGKSMAHGSIKGILVSLGSATGEVDAVTPSSTDIEESMVLLDVPCLVDGKLQDNGQQLSFDAMHSVVQHLHARGAAVYLGVTPRCLGQVARQRGMEDWKDWTYDPQSRTLRRSPYYSLHFEGYRAFLVDWLAQLRDLPLTGLVIRNAVPVGLHEGFNPLAVQLFAREFEVGFDPVRMFNDDRAVLAIDTEPGVHLPAVFWKWAGWKARERLRSLRDLVQALRVRLPHLEFGMTLQSRSITNPVRGLIHFAEDWVDVTRGPFDRFLITIEEPDSTLVHQTAQSSPQGSPEHNDEMAAVVKMVEHLGTPGKIWTILPDRIGRARMQSGILPPEVGLIYHHRGIP